MNRIAASQYAKALSKQRALTDGEWIHRCDELFQQQRVLFLELVTFARDGASDAQFRSLVDFLSCLQHLAVAEAGSVAAPVELPEFQAAIARATRFFQSMATDKRNIYAWQQDVTRSEPVVWAACIDTLQQHGIMSSPLMQSMVVTLHAIADVFSRRFASVASPVPVR